MGEAQKSYERGQVIEIITSVVSKMEANNDISPKLILEHIAELAETIDKLKADISETNTHHLTESEIPDATDQLDAVVEATAEATNAIMNACEEIEKVAGNADADAQHKLINEVTCIYEACSFQDITGQRITKVVTTLKTIEEQVGALMNMLNQQVGPFIRGGRQAKVAARGDDALLNGPQRADKAITQDDIDKLLEEFG